MQVPAPLPGPPVKTVLVAAVALINDAGDVLLAQRPLGRSMAGLWEFPGGKVCLGYGVRLIVDLSGGGQPLNTRPGSGGSLGISAVSLE